MAKIKLGKKEGWDIPIVGFKPEDAGITKEQATKFDQFLAHRCRNNKGQPVISFCLVYSGIEALDMSEYHELPIGTEIRTPNFDMVYAYLHEKKSNPPSLNDWKTIPKSFPYQKLVLNPDGLYVLRYFVSPDGDDNNDGSSWEKAKRQPQAAIDDLPPDLLGFGVFISIEGGDYSTVNITTVRNGWIRFFYAGAALEDFTGDWVTWIRRGTSKVFTNTNPVKFKTTNSTPAFRFNTDKMNLSFKSGNPAKFWAWWESDYESRFGAFEMDGTDGNAWSLIDFYGAPTSSLFVDSMKITLGGTTGIGLNCNCHVSFWGSLQVVGGNGGASTGNGEWTGGINVYGAYAGFINFCTNSVNYHPDYNKPDNSDLHITDVKQGIFCNTSTDLIGRNTSLINNNFYYTDNIRSYVKTEIRLSGFWNGYLGYNSDYATLTGTHNDIILYDQKTSTRTVYLSKDLHDDGTHLYYKGVQLD